MLDVKDTVILVKQCQRYFLLVDCFTGLQLCTYEGRHLSNPKFQGRYRFQLVNVCLSKVCGLCCSFLLILCKSCNY